MDALKWDREFALEQAADDSELLQELIEIFKDSCATDFSLIEEGISESDAEKVCSAAHSIKGASASLGVEGIQEIVLSIETDSRKGSLEVAKEKLEELKGLLQLLQKI